MVVAVLQPRLSCMRCLRPSMAPPPLPPIRIKSGARTNLTSASAAASAAASTVDAAFVSAAFCALTSHRSKRRWSLLRSLLLHSPSVSSATVSAILLRLRRRPRLALRFFLWSLRPPLSPSPSPFLHDPSSFSAAAHLASSARLRPLAVSILRSSILLFDPTSPSPSPSPSPPEHPLLLLRTLAATYRAFDSAPFVFDLLLLAYLRLRRLPRALQLLRLLASRGHRPFPAAAASLLRSVSASLGSDAALQIYHEIYNPVDSHAVGRIGTRVSPSVRTFNALLLSLYRENKLERSVEIRREMDAFRCAPNAYTYSILMAGLCDHGSVDEARQLWEEMAAKGIRADIVAFNTLIGGYCGAGEMGKAEELFREMVLDGIEPTATTFDRLIRGHCKVGDVDSALLVYRDMKRKGFGIEVSSADLLLDEMRERGMVVEGLELLREEMRREGFAASRKSYQVLIRGFCGKGEVEAAMKLQAEMAGKGFQAGAKVYDSFIRAYERAGDIQVVERLKAEMVEMGANAEGD